MKVAAPLSKDSSSVRFAPVVQRAPEFAPSAFSSVSPLAQPHLFGFVFGGKVW